MSSWCGMLEVDYGISFFYRSQVAGVIHIVLFCCSSEVTDLKYDVPIGQKY